MSVLRCEQWSLSFVPQYTEAVAGIASIVHTDGVIYPAYITYVPGIFSSANLPDPEFAFEPHWAYGTASMRNWYIAYKGKINMTGSIGDIQILNGFPIRYPIGPCATTATAVNTLGSTVLDNDEAVGQTTLTFTVATNFAISDIIRVGNETAWNVEYHMIKSIVGAPNVVIYEHIEITDADADFYGDATVTGVLSAKVLTIQFFTKNEIHGDCTGAFTVGETLTGNVTGAHTCTVTKTNSGLRFDHLDLEAVVECDDIIDDYDIGPGAVSFSVAAGTDAAANAWTASDYICIGYGSKYAEVRDISSVAAGPPFVISFADPLVYDHSHYGAITDLGTSAPSYYTHTITEDLDISPIQISVVNTDVDMLEALMRRYIGCKVNRGTFRATEGEIVRFSWDEIIARNMKFKDYSTTATVTPWYSANISAPTVSYPITEPYYFSYGQLTYAAGGTGYPIARIKEFTLDISNNIEPKYYINDDNSTGRIPYELREGRKEYRLALNVDVDASERDLFLDLLRQGDYTAVYKGVQVTLVLTRGSNDTITITTPPSAPATGGDAMGCLIRTGSINIMEGSLINIPLDLLVRSIKIEIKDAIAVYP